MNNSEINDYFNCALKLVKECGKLISEAKNIKVQTKKEAWDIVTQYDGAVEKILIQKIKEKFPNHRFISEEDCADKSNIPDLTNDPTWFIDPIDGTVNFTHNFPVACVSVAFVVNKEPVIGITYNPFLEQMFTAVKGGGAFLNGKRIYTSQQDEISKSVLNYEISLARSIHLRDLYFYRLKHLLPAIRDVRSLGSAALGLCYVANGWMDAYQCDGLYPWDSAAGAVIVREAGGYICQPTGADFDVMVPNFLAASTKMLAEDFVKVEKRADEERLSNENTNGASH